MITKKDLIDMIDELNTKYGINPKLQLIDYIGLSGTKFYIVESIPNKITLEFGTKDRIYFYLHGLIDCAQNLFSFTNNIEDLNEN